MSPPEVNKSLTILITGFGPFLDITTNPSWSIIQTLNPSNLPLNTTLAMPTSPMPISYHKMHELIPHLYEQYNPDIVLHLGLAVERTYFAMEKSASRDGYHEVPDEERRVWTRGENKKLWGKENAVLASSFNIENVVASWQSGVAGVHLGANPSLNGGRGKNKGKSSGKGRTVEVRASDDVGNYVCGFLYYASLLEMGRSGNGRRRDVVFLHVPPLEGEGDVLVGARVVEKAVEALVGEWREREVVM